MPFADMDIPFGTPLAVTMTGVPDARRFVAVYATHTVASGAVDKNVTGTKKAHPSNVIKPP